LESWSLTAGVALNAVRRKKAGRYRPAVGLLQGFSSGLLRCSTYPRRMGMFFWVKRIKKVNKTPPQLQRNKTPNGGVSRIGKSRANLATAFTCKRRTFLQACRKCALNMLVCGLHDRKERLARGQHPWCEGFITLRRRGLLKAACGEESRGMAWVAALVWTFTRRLWRLRSQRYQLPAQSGLNVEH
jgi:hypothetical protein